MTLAQHTQLGPWSRGVSDEVICQECDWGAGPGSDRTVLYEARRHVVETGHVIDYHRTFTRQVFLADHEPLR
jgi:hypothetical protein